MQFLEPEKDSIKLYSYMYAIVMLYEIFYF